MGMWGKRNRAALGALSTIGTLAVVCAAAAAQDPQASSATASCSAPKHMMCVRFDGTAKGSQSSPRFFATSKQDQVHWHLEWVVPSDGNGTSQNPTGGSNAGGSGLMTFQAPQPGCVTGFDLSSFYPPTLVEKHPFRRRHSRVLILVPDPIEESSGGGAGNPSIVVRHPSCPALIGALPGSFHVLVNVLAPRHGHTFHVKGGGPFSQPGIAGTSTMNGTITVVVH